MPKITNNSRALQGFNAVSGVVYLQPGESRDLEFNDIELASVKKLAFVGVDDSKAATVEVAQAKTPAEVLALFDDDATHFQTAKVEAAKLLGDKTPSTKDDIIAALKAL